MLQCGERRIPEPRTWWPIRPLFQSGVTPAPINQITFSRSAASAVHITGLIGNAIWQGQGPVDVFVWGGNAGALTSPLTASWDLCPPHVFTLSLSVSLTFARFLSSPPVGGHETNRWPRDPNLVSRTSSGITVAMSVWASLLITDEPFECPERDFAFLLAWEYVNNALMFIRPALRQQ